MFWECNRIQGVPYAHLSPLGQIDYEQRAKISRGHFLQFVRDSFVSVSMYLQDIVYR